MIAIKQTINKDKIMDNRIEVYYDRLDLWGNKLRTRMLEPDKELPKNCFYTEKEARESLNKKLAIIKVDREKNLPIANEKLDKLELDIKALLYNSNCELSFTCDGDSYGIQNERIEISTKINGHTYYRELDL